MFLYIKCKILTIVALFRVSIKLPLSVAADKLKLSFVKLFDNGCNKLVSCSSSLVRFWSVALMLVYFDQWLWQYCFSMNY